MLVWARNQVTKGIYILITGGKRGSTYNPFTGHVYVKGVSQKKPRHNPVSEFLNVSNFIRSSASISTKKIYTTALSQIERKRYPVANKLLKTIGRKNIDALNPKHISLLSNGIAIEIKPNQLIIVGAKTDSLCYVISAKKFRDRTNILYNIQDVENNRAALLQLIDSLI